MPIFYIHQTPQNERTTKKKGYSLNSGVNSFTRCFNPGDDMSCPALTPWLLGVAANVDAMIY